MNTTTDSRDARTRETEMIERRLPVHLSDAEILDVSRKAAELYREQGQVEAEKREQALLFKGKLEALQAQITEMQQVVRSGIQWRPIACEVAFHRSLGEVTITRLDTGKIIETRPMTREERQMSMEL